MQNNFLKLDQSSFILFRSIDFGFYECFLRTKFAIAVDNNVATKMRDNLITTDPYPWTPVGSWLV